MNAGATGCFHHTEGIVVVYDYVCINGEWFEDSVRAFRWYNMIRVATLGCANLLRELKCLSREEYQVFKIARLVGLDTDLAEGSEYFKADKKLLLDGWRNPDPRLDVEKWEGTLEQAAERHASSHRLYEWYQELALTEGLIAVILLILTISTWVKTTVHLT